MFLTFWAQKYILNLYDYKKSKETVMSILGHLEPNSVFRFFEEICAIPHGSGNTAGMTAYLVKFAKDRGLEHRSDEIGNVIIRKPATPGYENVPGIIMQDIWIWLLLRLLIVQKI